MDIDQDEIVDAILKGLTKTDSLKRKHAKFWNSHKKSSKELGIFSEAFDGIQADYGNPITGWRRCDNDPPDVEFELAGKRIGVEITELVNEKAINAQIGNSLEYSCELLRFGVLAAEMRIREIINEKEEKVELVAANYDELVLLIHTDEPMLSSDEFRDYRVEKPCRYFHRIYLLFSYEPAKNSSPFIRIV